MSSVLHPPNCQWFSDVVIGHVKERSDRRSDQVFSGNDPNFAGNEPILALSSPSPPGTPPFAAYNAGMFSEALDECFLDSDDPPTDNKTIPPAKALDKEAIRRKRNRESMARARKNMKENEMALGQDCERLRQEIRVLQRQIDSPRASSLTKMTSWKVAAEYCRLFRNGLTSFLAAPEPYNTSAALCQNDCRVFQDFLSVVVAPDVLGERGRGIELLIDDWKWISSNLPDMKIELVRLEVGPGNSLIAATKDKFTITEDMLRRAFPLVVDGSLATLGAKLIGQQFEMRGTVTFEWDDKSDRIVGLKYTGDMITPLLKLLGSLEAVSRVFDNAFLTPECKLAGKASKFRFRGPAS